MPLFAKDFPTKTIYFGQDWVKIKPLPRSYFVQEELELSAATQGINIKRATTGSVELDGGLSEEQIAAVVKKQAEMDYQRVLNSIAEWSSEAEKTFENVMALEDSVFQRILSEINKTNWLSENEIKN